MANNNSNNQAAAAAASTDDVALQSASDSSSSSSSSSNSKSSLNDISSNSKVQGPLGIDPLRYTEFVFSLLLIWVLYLLVPRGLRVTYCGAYPKRYSWSSRIKRKRKQIILQRQSATNINNTNTTAGYTYYMNGAPTTLPSPPSLIPIKHTPNSGNLSVAAPSTYVSLDPFHIGDINNYTNATTAKTTNRKEQQFKHQQQDDDFDLIQIHTHNRNHGTGDTIPTGDEEELIHFQSPPSIVAHSSTNNNAGTGPSPKTAAAITTLSPPSSSRYNTAIQSTGLLKPNPIQTQDSLQLSSNTGTMSTTILPPLSTKSGRSTPTFNSAISTTNNNNNNNNFPSLQPNLTFTTTSIIYPSNSSTIAFHDEIAISTTMQRLRDVGVLVNAHGSKGKPKSVRLSLKENAIVWRTEIIKKATSSSSGGPQQQEKDKLKVGKEHQVPLTDILYVDVGKQTTALRRMENASIDESLCFSLLTKEGSLDLESTSMEERDALVSCFSLILDEVHKSIGGEQGSWRDIYRAPSSDLPSSFDEYDMQGGAAGGSGTLGIRSNPMDDMRGGGIGDGAGGIALLEM